MEDDLEQEVAELLFGVACGAASTVTARGVRSLGVERRGERLERVERLVGLLEEVARERRVGLDAVPRAARRAASAMSATRSSIASPAPRRSGRYTEVRWSASPKVPSVRDAAASTTRSSSSPRWWSTTARERVRRRGRRPRAARRRRAPRPSAPGRGAAGPDRASRSGRSRRVAEPQPHVDGVDAAAPRRRGRRSSRPGPRSTSTSSRAAAAARRFAPRRAASPGTA